MTAPGTAHRAAAASKQRHYRARTGRTPTARVNLAGLGALLAAAARADEALAAAAVVALGDDVVRRARAAHTARTGHAGTGRD